MSTHLLTGPLASDVSTFSGIASRSIAHEEPLAYPPHHRAHSVCPTHFSDPSGSVSDEPKAGHWSRVHVSAAGTSRCDARVHRLWNGPRGTFGPCRSQFGVNFDAAQTRQLIPICWFTGYSAEAETVFRLSARPGQVGVFRDDSSPPQQDPILDFGTLGFGTAGSKRCPGGLGYCCRCDGRCFVLTEAECMALPGGGGWAANYGCDPNPCGMISMDDGACCLPDATRRVYSHCACTMSLGIYKGDFVLCSPTLCSTPVQETTWGRIKSQYRVEPADSVRQ
jgi:hypothetical protein